MPEMSANVFARMAITARDRIKKIQRQRLQKRRLKLAEDRYGLPSNALLKMYEKQGGTCAICHQPENIDNLEIDHDHKTEAVRGLVHSIHNRTMGNSCDDPDELDRCAKYLRSFL